jgi:hypothetical protein
MTLTNQDIPRAGAFVAGDTLVTTIHVTDDSGIDYDLSAVSDATFVITTNPGEPPLVIKTLSDGIVVSGATTGRLQVTVPGAETAALEGNYFHETEITETDNRVSTVANGWLHVSEDTA